VWPKLIMIVVLAVAIGAPGFYFYVVMPRLRSPQRRLLTDDSGTAIVEGPFEFELDPDDGAWANLPPEVYAILDEAKVSLTELGSDRQFRFQEALLKAGDRISVLGRPTLEVDPGTGSRRTPPRLFHIRAMDDDPVVLADEPDPPIS